ncbi:hypothetical protein [Streptomyces sp. NBC_00347]|uniref:hypothetical protein n=1 Tax=Streptomyces sp. NBC_00347 TaxID=2975721 RepID=UPI0022528054|nr:hypothetical protein [Streptomyces sp. NBC_00347]MCX5126723.1 hypothetical protein [Streptomyces sp. NBC_00347]
MDRRRRVRFTAKPASFGLLTLCSGIFKRTHPPTDTTTGQVATGTRGGVTAPASGSGDVTVSVGASTGSYTGKPVSRGYEFSVHTAKAPTGVTVGSTTLAQQSSKTAYNSATTGWYFDANDRGGILWIKSGAFTVKATGTTLPTAGAIPVSPQTSASSPPRGRWHRCRATWNWSTLLDTAASTCRAAAPHPALAHAVQLPRRRQPDVDVPIRRAADGS